jgi:hypothetical protein
MLLLVLQYLFQQIRTQPMSVQHLVNSSCVVIASFHLVKIIDSVSVRDTTILLKHGELL